MKNYLNNHEKINIIILGIYKTLIYICWISFAFIFAYFINHDIRDNRTIGLIIVLLVIYTIRNIFKRLYKNGSYKSYHNLKHHIEVAYFKKIKNIDNEELIKLDKPSLSRKILEYSYVQTKKINDIIEFIIPSIICLIFFFFGLININIILAVVIALLLLGMQIVRYYLLKKKNVENNNYNDMLVDFINKIMTIKKLNIFSFCEDKLEENEESDIIILKNNDVSPDIVFSTSLTIILSIVFISCFLILKNNNDMLGYLLFFIIIIFKLQNLLYELIPALNNILTIKKVKFELDKYFANSLDYKYNHNWKKINVVSGTVHYTDNDITIKIPNFEFVRGDQISIIGKSGEGKSTILNVLSGMDKLDTGVVSIDNVKASKLIDVVYLSSNVELFNISLRDNLKLEKKVSDEELLNYLKELGLMDWYNSLPKGLDTIIHSDYINTSTSVIARLNIIRGIIINKEVYFFDEPTDAMDLDTEKIIVSILKKYFKKKTFIIITDRPILTTICKKHYFMKKHTLLDKEPLL